MVSAKIDTTSWFLGQSKVGFRMGEKISLGVTEHSSNAIKPALFSDL